MSFINKFKLFSLIAKYGIQLIDHSPGRVTVQIGAWTYYEEKLLHLITLLRKENHIHSIDVDENIVTIEFNPAVTNNEVTIKRLFTYIDEYDL